MKKEITITSEGDVTRELREILQNPDLHIYQFTQGGSEKEFLAAGKLPEDAEKFDRWEQGEAGIIRFERRNDIYIFGKSEEDKTVVYNNAPAVELNADGDNKIGYLDRSLQQAWNFIDVDGGGIKNIIFRDGNNEDGSKPGFPVFNPYWEFEHAFRAENVKNFIFENIVAQYVWADGFYVTGNENENLSFINCIVDKNGRQPWAVAGGKKILIYNPTITGSRRSLLLDIEPPVEHHVVNEIAVVGGTSKGQLTLAPSKGRGIVRNVLIKDHTFVNSATTIIDPAEGGIRENWIFKGNTQIGEFGAKIGAGLYGIANMKNVLIEGNSNPVKERGGSHVIANIIGERTENVHIRYNDFAGGKYIVLRDGVDPNQIKVYGNTKELFFMFKDEGERIEPVTEYIPTETEAHAIPWETTPWIQALYDGTAEIPHLPSIEYLEKNLVPTPVPPPVEIPDTPNAKAVEIGDTFIKLDFTTERTEYYKVNRFHTENEETQSLESVVTKGELVDENLLPNTEYIYKITARNKTGSSSPAIVAFKTLEVEEPKPTPEPPKEPQPETPKPQPEKSKWYENKLLWVVGVIVLVIILALVL